MLLIKLMNFFKGYVNIVLDGYFTERFINICIRRNILIWDIKRLGANRINAKVSINGFKELRPIAKKTKTHVTVIGRYGFPFVSHKYRKRRFALIGVIFCVCLLWYFSTHIMGIDISGNERIQKEDILNELRGFGLSLGTPVSKIDERLIQNQMTTRFDDIAWIGVNIRGSRAYIEIKERITNGEILDKSIPCSIVAEKSGIIEKIYVREGQTVVKLGDFVEEGDLLASGIMDSSRDGVRYVHSYGEVYAKTWYTETGEYPLEYEVREDTGNSKTRYGIEFLGFNLKLFSNNRQPFEHCRREEFTKELRLPFDIFPSLFIHTYKFSEQNVTIMERSEAEAVEIGKSELEEQIKRRLNADTEIRNTTVTYEKSQNGNIIVTAEVECFEDIAMQTVIDKIDIMPYDISSNENETAEPTATPTVN